MSGEEFGLPKTTVIKIVKEKLPADLRLSSDAGDVLMRCCDDFVHLLSSTANKASEKEKKNTIQPEHVLASLEELGFSLYLEDVRRGKNAVAAEKQERAERRNRASWTCMCVCVCVCV